MSPRGVAVRSAAWLGLLAGLGLAGCDDPCCAVDERPIALAPSTTGALLARLAGPDGEPGLAVLDTGTPISVWATSPRESPPRIARKTLTLLGAPAPRNPAPVRAVFRDVPVLETEVAPLGSGAGTVHPLAIIGGDVLRSFSVQLRFAGPEVTFLTRKPAPDWFLSGAGFAVLHLPLWGGGEVEAVDPEDTLSERDLFAYPASRLVLRACAGPVPFNRTDPLPRRCCPGQDRGLSTGVDLALLVATGVGPVVLGRSAWERLRARLSLLPPASEGPLYVATVADPIPAVWTTLPRMALVDREADLAADPGPCAELARARRLEQVAFRQSANSELAACALPCDVDPRARDRAQNSAAYIEVGTELRVAIIDDTHPLLQTVRIEVRPSAPVVDGLLGTEALNLVRLELDYVGKETRALFACEPNAPSDRCRSVPHCARLSGPGQQRICFGLPPHGLPSTCEPPVEACGS